MVVFFLSCSSKDEFSLYNKPALFWYNQLLKNIIKTNLDEADETFVSLKSEHSKSVYIEPSMLLLSKMHIKHEQYELANYYLDEYIKQYPFSDNIEYVKFLQLETKYSSMGYRYRDQKLLLQIKDDFDDFIQNYKNSVYIEMIKSMRTRIDMTIYQYNRSVVGLYDRIGKTKAKKFYIDKLNKAFRYKDLKEAKPIWYRHLFEEGKI